MNITQIKWNTEKPKFEDVEGKLVVVKYKSGTGEDIGLFEAVGKFIYDIWFDESFVSYYILTDEPVYCEWAKENNELGHEQLFPGCVKKDMQFMEWKSDIENMEYKFCPHCGNPIRVIEEVKPMELDGKLPKFELHGVDNTWRWYYGSSTIEYNRIFDTPYYVSIGYASKQDCITAWNSFVERMKK